MSQLDRNQTITDELAEQLLALGLDLEEDGLWVSGEEEVAVLATGRHVVVGWPEIRWTGPSQGARTICDATHRAVPLADCEQELVESARRAGAAHRGRCARCRGTFAPGRMLEELCHGCAAADGVVF